MKTILSKRFAHIEDTFDTAKDVENEHKRCNYFLKKEMYNIFFKKDMSVEERKLNFYSALHSLAADYEIDIDIFEYDTYANGKLYSSNITFTYYMTRMLEKILKYSDDFSVFALPQDDGTVTIIFSFIQEFTDHS